MSESRKQVGVKREKDVYTKEWEVEIRSYLVTPWCTGS